MPDHPAGGLPPQPTLRSILDEPGLHLQLVTPDEGREPDALARPVRWVHASDLPDPTPFLAEDLVLLTTGTQFIGQEPTGPVDYVKRLAHSGVVALGFGTDVAHAQIPAALKHACVAEGIPLFTVPYRTPFIAVARRHAEAVAAHAFGRRNWALETQRALVLAALRPHGLDAILTELSRRLGTWVGMVDATGRLAFAHPADATIPTSELLGRATEIVARGRHTSDSLPLSGRVFTLFSLGREEYLRGVIAIASGPLDPEARLVVTAVIAMAGFALDQGEDLHRQRRRLHTQLLASLQTGDPALARRVLGRLPAAPFVVAVAAPGGPVDALGAWWERQAGPGEVFAAGSDVGHTVCLTADREGLLADAAARFGIRFGVSSPARYEDFPRAQSEALSAVRHGTTPVTRFSDTASASLVRAMATDDARLAAAARLAPLRTDGNDLERCLRVWLANDAKLEPAAAELGIHRHTLRSRIARAATLLRMDLSTFAARAELWAALHAR